ncbi:MAG: hypothetical protein HQK49_07455 [Oligoflexia bacterium]|nr:hypothetical protein [Oligoflexia bacterium]
MIMIIIGIVERQKNKDKGTIFYYYFMTFFNRF